MAGRRRKRVRRKYEYLNISGNKQHFFHKVFLTDFLFFKYRKIEDITLRPIIVDFSLIVGHLHLKVIYQNAVTDMV